MQLGIRWLAMFVAIVSSFSGVAAWGARLSSYCYAPINDLTRIRGENIDERIPVASVSKLITAHWAVRSKGVNYRFQTLAHLTPVDRQTYDLHMQGSRDPYMGAEQLHYMISELNRRGIKRIRNFTFDQNFKFFWFADDPESNRNIAVGFYVNTDPSPQTVRNQLRAYSELTRGYQETRKKALDRGLRMVENPEFSIENIEPLNAGDFQPRLDTRTFVVNSVRLANLLKEMNRNSNNHAANQIFEHLGSSRAFQSFIDQTLQLKREDVVMLNGSGDRVDTANGARYNEASCSAMLKIMADLHNSLAEQGSAFSRVATVIGTNPGNATNLYKLSLTDGAVIAKTGTVNPSVSLGGLMSTKKGLYLFMINVNPRGSFGGGRQIIRDRLNDLVNDLGGPVSLNAQPFSFISFDSRSFVELKAQKENLK